ncbi:MAG: MFS transporter [Acidobacteriota bacterium]
MKKLLDLYLDAYRGLPREVWFLSAVLLVNRSGTMVLTFLTLYLTLELGWTLTLAGQVLSIYGVGHLAGAWIGGWLCDRIGGLRIQFLSLLLSGLGMFVLEHLRTPTGVMLATFFVATTAESFRPANGATLAAFSPPHLRTRAVALNRMALNLGFAFGPAVGGWLAVRDYSLLFWVDGVTCILAAFLLRALLPHEPIEATDESAAGQRAALELHPMKDWIFLAFLGLVVLLTLGFFQGWSTYPVFLNEVYGLAESQFGLLMTLNAVLILAFEMILTHRAEVFRPLSVVGAGTFLFGLGMTVLLFGNHWMLAVFSVVIWTTGEMLAAPFAGGWVANRAGPKHRGKYMGLYTMAWGLGFIIAPSGGAWIYQHFGPNTLWLATGLLGAVTWIGFELLDRRIRQLPIAAVAEST